MNERTLFLEALEKSDPAERAALLEKECGGNALLRQRVESLLEAHAVAGDFLKGSPLPADVQATELLTGDTDNAEHPISPADAQEIVSLLGFLKPSQRPGGLGRLDHYEILSVIGQGGMGIVLKAHDEQLDRHVAIKVLAPEFATNAESRKRFLREARAAAAVVHPHVVTIHAIAEQRPPYLVMELVGGQSLQDKLQKVGALPVSEILRIGSQIGLGLAAAHKQGLVHRDIKPGNILLENGVERVKITDFGLARAANDIAITGAGAIAGTPQFMSPEQAQGEPLDFRSDLFSLGSVLYTMATGRPPFRADTAVAVLRRVSDESPRPIQELNREIPDWLVAIIEKLMAKRPEERIQTAQEMAELLSSHLAELQQPTGRHIPLPAPASQPKKAPVSQPLMVPVGIRWPLVIATVLFCLLALPLTAIVFYVRLRSEPQLTVGGAPVAPSTNLARLVAAAHENELQGTWVALAGEQQGEPLAEEKVEAYQLQFKGDQLTSRTPDEAGLDGRLELDPSQSPHRIRIVTGGNEPPATVTEGIYELSGDRLRVCLGEPGEQITEFKSKAGSRRLALDLVRRYRADGTLILPATPGAKPSPWPLAAAPNTPPANASVTRRPEDWYAGLAGWRAVGGTPATWKLENGTFRGAGAASFLVSDRSYQNFHVKAEMRVSPGGEWGMIFRTPLADLPAAGATDRGLGVRFTYKGSTNDVEGHMRMQAELVQDGRPLARSIINVKPNGWFPIELTVNQDKVDLKLPTGGLGASKLSTTSQPAPVIFHLPNKETVLELRQIQVSPVDEENEVVSPDKMPAAEESGDAKALQGTWKLTSVGPTYLDITFNGSKCEFKWRPKGPEPPPGEKAKDEKRIEGSFQLDSSIEPHRLTMLDAKDQSPLIRAIYRLEGDTLFLCYILDPQDDTYPRKLATDPDQKAVLAVLKHFVADQPMPNR